MGCTCDKLSVLGNTRGLVSPRKRILESGVNVQLIKKIWQVLQQDIANIGVSTFVR